MLEIYQKINDIDYEFLIRRSHLKMTEIKIVFSENNEIKRLPVYATNGSAGFDLYSVEDLSIKPKDIAVVKTGISIEIPSGFEVQIRSRSGLAAKSKVFVLNSPGTIDSDYRGEVCVILANLSDNDFVISKGDRIAQAVLSKYEIAKFTLLDSLSETSRGANGFGSSGLK